MFSLCSLPVAASPVAGTHKILSGPILLPLPGLSTTLPAAAAGPAAGECKSNSESQYTCDPYQCAPCQDWHDLVSVNGLLLQRLRSEAQSLSVHHPRLPAILVLAIGGRVVDGQRKNRQPIAVCLRLELQNHPYQLRSVIIHRGNRTVLGHYFLYRFSDPQKNQWCVRVLIARSLCPSRLLFAGISATMAR